MCGGGVLMGGAAFERIRTALIEHGLKITGSHGDRFQAQCPAHDDTHPSLSVRDVPALNGNDGHALIHCFKNCKYEDIMAALGLEPRDGYDMPRNQERYEYRDLNDDVNRWVTRNIAHKSFSQKIKQKGAVVLYRLEEVRQAVSKGDTVYFVEGEKDANNGRALTGETFTTAPQGAANVDKADMTMLKGAHVTAIVDKDDAGAMWASKLAHALAAVGVASVQWCQAAVGKDLSDHLAAGYSLEQLLPIEPPQQEAVKTVKSVEPTKIIIDKPLSEYAPRRTKSLWEGKLPLNRVVVIGGRGGAGKSTFAIWIAAQITTGTLEGELFGTPHKVHIVTTEDGTPNEWRARFEVNGGDSRLAVPFITALDDGTSTGFAIPLRLPDDFGLLRESVRKHHSKLLIIDPITAANQGDNQKNQDVQALMRDLNMFAQDEDLTVLCVLHTRKNGGRADESLSGAAQWFDGARGVALVATDDDGSSVVTFQKFNQHENGRKHKSYSFTLENTPMLDNNGEQVWDDGAPVVAGKVSNWGESDFTYEQVTNNTVQTKEDALKAIDRTNWLREQLTGATTSMHDSVLRERWRKEFHKSDATYYRDKEKAGIITEKLSGFQAESIVYLPEHTPPAFTEMKNERIGESGGTFPLDSNDSANISQSFQKAENESIVKGLGNPHHINEKPQSKPQSFHFSSCPLHGEKFDAEGGCEQCKTQAIHVQGLF